MRSLPRAAWRRTLAAAAALVVASGLTACGGSAADTGHDTGSASGSQASAEGFPRTVEHHKGTTEIPAKPERIVALDNSLVEAVVALDRPLVGGIGAYRDLEGFPDYLGDAVEDTEDVGPLESPDLEAVAALEPDLIVSASVRHDALYDELSKIAPTVFVETTGPTWKANIVKLAEAMGEEEKAETALSAYEKRAAAVGEEVNAEHGDPTVSMVRFLDGPTRLYVKDSFSGIVFTDMDLARPKPQSGTGFVVEIGEEQIRKADGDHIFVSVYSDQGPQQQERFRRNPLWKRLEGVRKGNVHEVADEVWMTSVSLQGAHMMLDDMAKIFGVDPHTELAPKA